MNTKVLWGRRNWPTEKESSSWSSIPYQLFQCLLVIKVDHKPEHDIIFFSFPGLPGLPQYEVLGQSNLQIRIGGITILNTVFLVEPKTYYLNKFFFSQISKYLIPINC